MKKESKVKADVPAKKKKTRVSKQPKVILKKNKKYRVFKDITNQLPNHRYQDVMAYILSKGAKIKANKETLTNLGFDQTTKDYALMEIDRHNGATLAKLKKEHPYELMIHMIYKDESVTSHKWVIEALALAGATHEVIANRLGLDVEIVTMYLRIFFDVTNTEKDKERFMLKLNAEIQANYCHSMHMQSHMWKSLGYYGGLAPLNRILANPYGEMTTEETNWFTAAKISLNKVAALSAQQEVNNGLFKTETQLESLKTVIGTERQILLDAVTILKATSAEERDFVESLSKVFEVIKPEKVKMLNADSEVSEEREDVLEELGLK